MYSRFQDLLLIGGFTAFAGKVKCSYLGLWLYIPQKLKLVEYLQYPFYDINQVEELSEFRATRAFLEW